MTNQRLEIDQRPSAPKRRKLDNQHEFEEGSHWATTSTRFSHDDYTVGWICALPLEMAAAKAMLDEIHPSLPNSHEDHNTYTLGQIGAHNIVIACMPSGVYGTTSAVTVAASMRSSFRSIHVGLMVGIGGGAPSRFADIRLGDVVVSKPNEHFGGVVQHDYGKITQDGIFKRIGTLNKPPLMLLTAVSQLQANHNLKPSRIPEYLSGMASKYPAMVPDFVYCDRRQDYLFEAEYEHNDSESTCEHCDPGRLITRLPRTGSGPVIHYGPVASGNQVMKHGITRDRWAQEYGILCFEMEAAGLMDLFPCLVIRGICDYADSHKSKQWQGYAAATAAAYAKEILSVISGFRVSKSLTIADDRSLPMLDKEQKQMLLDSLRFDEINARHMTIKNTHAKTCTWLISNPEYLDWLNPNKLSRHHGFLWIKGKPGAGKSTLMKFALAHARKRPENQILISFFFNARGDDLGKSTMGMYRSLLLQLLERVPSLQSIFDSLELATLTTGCQEWSIESLKNLFEEAVQGLGNSSLVCFIDALDECDERQIRDMVAFFQHLGELAVLTHKRFQVLFSSRHYPHITISKCLSLVLEGQEGHSQDIADYVHSELRIGHSTLSEQIRAELQKKSSGVFMWVVLVVDILNKEHDEGRTTRRLQQKLRDLPSDLHELFRDLLKRDRRNRDELLLCIQWLLFASRPLKPEELYFGMISGNEPQDLSKWNSEEMPIDAIKRFILNASKGLAEVTKSETPTVQFIHESVRDFLLHKNGLSEVCSGLGNDIGAGHERLKNCCSNYMSIDIINHLNIGIPLPKASSEDAALLRQSAANDLPFLDYAIRNILYHADKAQVSGIDQTNFLHTFQLAKWVWIDNLFEKNEGLRHTPNVSLFYLLAERNCAGLIKFHPSHLSCFDVEIERYGSPIFAALATGSNEAVRALLDVEADTYPTTSPFRHLCEQYHQGGNRQINLRRNFTFSQRRNSLSYLAEHGSYTLFALFCASGKFNIKSIDYYGRTPLSWAAKEGHEAIAKLLLDKGADLEIMDQPYGQTPLSLAAQRGREAVVRLLLERGADQKFTKVSRLTPLLLAAERGWETVVRLLLDKGADLESRDTIHHRTPLLWAARQGHDAVVRLLHEEGADLEAKDGVFGRTSLSWAAQQGHEAVVRLLLENGADLEAKGSFDDRTSLSWAAYQGHAAVVRLLLEKGADLETKHRIYSRTALSLAAQKGHAAVVRLLLEKGADLEAKDSSGWTALSWAADLEHEEVVELLQSQHRGLL